MENLYTIDDIKKYFDYLMNNYPNSNMYSHANMIKYTMFKKDSVNNFEKIIKKMKKEEG